MEAEQAHTSSLSVWEGMNGWAKSELMGSLINQGSPQPQPGRGTNGDFEAGLGMCLQPSPPVLPSLLRLFPASLIILLWQ